MLTRISVNHPQVTRLVGTTGVNSTIGTGDRGPSNSTASQYQRANNDSRDDPRLRMLYHLSRHSTG
jgi:hypothetical protein